MGGLLRAGLKWWWEVKINNEVVPDVDGCKCCTLPALLCWLGFGFKYHWRKEFGHIEVDHFQEKFFTALRVEISMWIRMCSDPHCVHSSVVFSPPLLLIHFLGRGCSLASFAVILERREGKYFSCTCPVNSQGGKKEMWMLAIPEISSEARHGPQVIVFMVCTTVLLPQNSLEGLITWQIAGSHAEEKKGSNKSIFWSNVSWIRPEDLHF